MNSTLAPHRPSLPSPRLTRGAPLDPRSERSEPAWARPALIVLLVLTAAAYLVDLSASGYANSFYAAATQAATKSWKAFFFGSIDSSNFITVDKPPASIWVMALSGRIFGFSSWSMLVPQALEGVAAGALLHAGVKRWFGAGAGLMAGALFALTPVAALMFRFNNPDALLVCLLIAAAYCLVRAIERGATRWVLAAGALVGLAFLAKMMQAFLVLPAFGLVYVLAAPNGLRRRLAQTFAGGAAILLSAGWWVAIVALWPASSRPFIDGSPSNSILNLITGYNGLGRIFGSSGPGGGGGANFSGPTGLLRLFDSAMGSQASWLLPAAVLALLAGLWSSRHAPRTDRTRAALLLWGGWLVVSALVFSLGSGVIHTYYTVALAPAIAAPIAITGAMLWRTRHSLHTRAIAAVGVLLTAGWSWVLLDRTPQWQSWLLVLVPVSAGLALAGLLAAPALRRLGRGLLPAVAMCALLACLSGPIAYSAQTVTSPHTGSIPSAGPGASGIAGGGAGGGSDGASSSLEAALKAGAGSYRWVAGVSGSQNAASLELATGGEPVMAIGGFDNEGGNLTLAQFKQYVAKGEIHYYIATSGGGVGFRAQSGGRASGAAQPGGGTQGPPGGTPPSGASTGAGAGRSAGAAPAAGAARSVGAGKAGFPGAGGATGGSGSSAIASWVKAHFKVVTVGSQKLYDLTQPRS